MLYICLVCPYRIPREGHWLLIFVEICLSSLDIGGSLLPPCHSFSFYNMVQLMMDMFMYSPTAQKATLVLA